MSICTSSDSLSACSVFFRVESEVEETILLVSSAKQLDGLDVTKVTESMKRTNRVGPSTLKNSLRHTG